MADTSDTSVEAYRKIRDNKIDVKLRRRVAAALVERPMTVRELDEVFDDHSRDSIRPRVNELVRMGCVEREGKKKTPSGYWANVNHLTALGSTYVAGEADPDPGPTVAELKKDVVNTARDFVQGETEEDALKSALLDHDDYKRRLDPEWEP